MIWGGRSVAAVEAEQRRRRRAWRVAKAQGREVATAADLDAIDTDFCIDRLDHLPPPPPCDPSPEIAPYVEKALRFWYGRGCTISRVGALYVIDGAGWSAEELVNRTITCQRQLRIAEAGLRNPAEAGGQRETAGNGRLRGPRRVGGAHTGAQPIPFRITAS